ncbi:ROK family protein [Rubrolithibacter danxiaensis]|uniref:ROK family protein n=1 Tax=Rubrolithibacter danxiaensis TaxID=3390805 RepID=UPI003BF8E38A
MNNEIVIGVAIEDAHISAGIVDLETRKVIGSSLQRKRVNPSGSADEIISSWAKVLKDVAGSASKVKLGIGLPGLCEYDTGVYLMNDKGRYDSLYKSNLKELLSAQMGITPADIRLLNDAACFLQGEVFGGAGRGFRRSLGVTLGVGLGSATYVNGVVQDADLKDMPLFEGVAEDYISIRWLLQRFETLSGIKVRDMIELKQLAATDSRVQLVFDEFAENISQFLVRFISQHNPEIVIIGGFMETFNRFFFDNLTRKMPALGIRIPILRAVLGEQASVIGAASTWYEAKMIHA